MSALPHTSRAAVLVDYNQPLEIRELAVPPLEPGAILVKVEAATVCGTDVHVFHGKLTQISQLPLVPGHEIAFLLSRSHLQHLSVRRCEHRSQVHGTVAGDQAGHSARLMWKRRAIP